MKQMLTHTHTHTQENKKWEIKTWEKWYWGIVEVILIISLAILTIYGLREGNKIDREWVEFAIAFLAILNLVFLIIWGIIKLIIWLVNRNKKKIDN